MPRTQQPSTHAAPPPTRSPRHFFSAVASDRRCRPSSHPWEILRCSFRSSSTYSHRLPIARTPFRKESTNTSSSAVIAVINAIRKFSDNDSQDSSSATTNSSTQLSDVPHQDDSDHDHQEIADELSVFSNKPAPRTGILNPRCDPENLAPFFIDGSSRPHSRPKLSASIRLTPTLDGNLPPQRDHVINYRICPGLSHTRSGPGHIYRGPQGPVLDGVPLGKQGIEGINNNGALSLTLLAAVTFTPDLPPTDTNPAGHRPRTHALDSAPMPPKAVVIACGGGSSIRVLDDIFEPTRCHRS